MTPPELVSDLEARGVTLWRAGDQLGYRAPRGVLQDAEREALRARKAAILALLREREARRPPPGADWSRVSLYQLDKVLEVAVPSDVPLILAPGCRIARELRARDPQPGRVWCTCEVLDLLLTNVPPDDARKVAEAKLLLAGTLRGQFSLNTEKAFERAIKAITPGDTRAE